MRGRELRRRLALYPEPAGRLIGNPCRCSLGKDKTARLGTAAPARPGCTLYPGELAGSGNGGGELQGLNRQVCQLLIHAWLAEQLMEAWEWWQGIQAFLHGILRDTRALRYDPLCIPSAETIKIWILRSQVQSSSTCNSHP